MGTEDIVARILSDADAEAAEIVASAEQSAKETLAAAERRAEERMAETREEVALRAQKIADGRAAAARLDAQKLLLFEKRRAIDEIYARALQSLMQLGKADSLRLVGNVLEAYAEEGDEVLFAEDYPYAAEAEKLPVFTRKKLVASAERAAVKGGFLLRGKLCDKDLSFGALLAADREKAEAELAARLFAVTPPKP